MSTPLSGLDSFVARVERELGEVGVDGAELAQLDHVGYRVETIERYKTIRQDIGRIATLIDESDVGGRPISVFEFEEPLKVGAWRVLFFEVPAPKAGSPHEEGLDHAEFVTIGSLASFKRRHPTLTFNLTGSRVNQTLGLKLATLTIKFHELSLGAVIGIEQRLAAEGEAHATHPH